MNFSKKLTITVSASILLCSMINISHAEGTFSERKKQIRSQESIIENNAKRGIAEVKDKAKLGDYIKAGLNNNPGVKAAFYEWKSSFSKISQAFSLPDPQFSYTDYSKESDKQEAHTVSQMIFWPGKIWIKKARAVMGSEEAYYKFQSKRLELVQQITEAYYEYAYLSKALLITRENMNLLKNFEGVAQARYSSGLTKNQDLLKIQVELGKLENELTSMEDMRYPLMARLIALLSLPEDTQLPWPTDSLEDVAMSADYEKVALLIKQMQAHNPELAAFEKNVESERQGLKLAKKAYIPDLMISLTQEKMRPTTMGSQEDPLMIMFSVNVPLWFWRTNAEIQDARASMQAAEANRENKSNELESMLSMTHYKLRDALRQSQLYKDALIPKALQTYNATKSAYETGDMDFLSFIDAQRMLLDFQIAYYRNNVNFYQRLAELKSLLGELTADIE